MSKEIKKSLVPKLRFPEFRDAGEWGEKQLSSILDYERPDKYIVIDTNYQQSGTPVLTANKSFILGYTQEDKGIYEDTPVIIFDDFTVDKKYVDFSFKVKSSAIKILKIKNKNNLKFVFEAMNLIRFDAQEHKRYYISAYQNLFIPLPKLKEQTAIADCLSSIDELITAQTQKIEALKAHKKGLMQKLFPAEGETVPKLRFPKFRDAGEWEDVKLGDLVDKGLCVIKNSLRQPLSSKKRSMMQGNYPYYGATGQIDSINDYKLEGCHLLIAEDGTVTRDGKKPTLQLVDGKFWVSNHAHVLQAKSSQGTLMLYYMLSNINISTYITGAVQLKLSKSNLLKVKFTLPSLPEQKAIANCLSSIDELITAQTQKIDALKAHKKGLMQRLFPSH